MKLITTAYTPDQIPEGNLPEVVVLGRSNSGKSSFINALANGRVAKVSQTPGKTRSLNFYNFKKKYMWVDMPGYGFAARAGGEQKSWNELVEAYLFQRGVIGAMVLLMDIRRKWTEDEQLLLDFAAQIGKPLVLVLTKADKLSKGKAIQLSKKFKKDLGVADCLWISSLKKKGIEELEESVFQAHIKHMLK